MQHFIAPLLVAGLFGLQQGATPAALVRVPEVTITVQPHVEVYVPIKYVPLTAAEPELAVGAERPTEWMPKLRRCARRGARRFCDGPRMVPLPEGPAAERAARLGLGTPLVASQAMLGRPDPAWIAEIGSKDHATLRFPVDGGRVGRGVGYVRRSELSHVHHDGIDIAAAPGTLVRSVEDGLVVYADNGVSGFGNLVVVVHPDGSTGLYAHLSASWLFAGQRVRRGEVVGEVGNTGLSHGPHLHFEWRVAGRPRNPVPRFERAEPPAEDPGHLLDGSEPAPLLALAR